MFKKGVNLRIVLSQSKKIDKKNYRQKLVFNFGNLLEPTFSYMLKIRKRSLSNDRDSELSKIFNTRLSVEPIEPRPRNSPVSKFSTRLSPLSKY